MQKGKVRDMYYLYRVRRFHDGLTLFIVSRDVDLHPWDGGDLVLSRRAIDGGHYGRCDGSLVALKCEFTCRKIGIIFERGSTIGDRSPTSIKTYLVSVCLCDWLVGH